MSVLEVGIPSGYIVHNNTLQSYVKGRKAANSTLKNAESYNSKAVFYFDYVSGRYDRQRLLCILARVAVS